MSNLCHEKCRIMFIKMTAKLKFLLVRPKSALLVKIPFIVFHLTSLIFTDQTSHLGPIHTYPDIFWIRNFFFPDSKLSPSTGSVFKSNSAVYTHPMVSRFTLIPKASLHWNVFGACAVERGGDGKFALPPSTLCRHISLLFGERLNTLFTSSDSKISGLTLPNVIRFVVVYFFSTLESRFIFSGFAVEFTECVWTVAVSGKKKLRIRKYPDTGGRGLRLFVGYSREQILWNDTSR